MSDIQDSVDLLIEKAHLAIIRMDTYRARTLLKKALELDPMHTEASRMLQSLPSPQNSQPRMAGETEHDFAARIAYRAGIEERARLDGDPWIPAQDRQPSRWAYGPFGPYLKAARVALYMLAGVLIVMYLPLGKIHPDTIRHVAHLSALTSILFGALLGFGGSFLPASPPRRLRRW
ncbi:MAG: hypothetical protein ABIY70_10260 [Capsulimonas sp.]|uniref:hypothetical protein n=1 Tax=Capsulimonas sp. TaxID=2494211 RepID=UPI003265CD78